MRVREGAQLVESVGDGVFVLGVEGLEGGDVGGEVFDFGLSGKDVVLEAGEFGGFERGGWEA